MTDTPTSTYEGLFLFPQAVISDMQAAVDHVNSLLDRAGAEVIAMSKWDERRLAYDIKGNKRGVYFLAYFKAAHDKLAGLERDCNLSEQLLRALVTRADHVPAELIESAEGRAQIADEIKMREVPEDSDTPRAVIERVEASAPAKVEAAPEPAAEAAPEAAEEAAEAPETAPETTEAD
ncbi:MAG: 30S ribosomal protein S6 [Phycisphaerales bacterium]|nr:30S ribosomal protein S6 [Phycisphaerales bacterium]